MTKHADQELNADDDADVVESAVAAAFEAHVQTLYKTLVSGLATGDAEKDCLKRFNAGIDIACRAVLLATGQEQPK